MSVVGMSRHPITSQNWEQPVVAPASYDSLVDLDDVARLAECCAVVPPATGVYEYDDFVTNLLLTVVDYMQNTTTVERAIAHYQSQRFEALRTIDELKAVMARYPDDEGGNKGLAQFLWGYDLWTRAEQLRRLVAFFESMGVTDQVALRLWASTAEFSRDFEGRVKGLGIAVFNWLVMRLGVDTAKPDVQVRRFVEECLDHSAGSDQQLVALVAGAAAVLGKSVRDLDWAIWEHMRAAPRMEGPPVATSVPTPVLVDEQEGASAADDNAGTVAFRRDETGYRSWLAAHPAGFVLACDPKPKAGATMLHRASCRTISDKPARGSTFTSPYMKVCATTRETVVAWTIAKTSASPRRCRICNPAG